MTVDHARTRAAKAYGRWYAGLRGKGVGDRVVLPGLQKGRIDVPSGVAPYQVNLAVVIARGHKGAHVRHRRAGAPRVGSNVVNASGSDHDARDGIVATEDEELIDVRRIHT
jgi:hypothetical protein